MTPFFLNLLRIALLTTLPVTSVADWPMLGRDQTRNPVSSEKNSALNWNVQSGRNIKWKRNELMINGGCTRKVSRMKSELLPTIRVHMKRHPMHTDAYALFFQLRDDCPPIHPQFAQIEPDLIQVPGMDPVRRQRLQCAASSITFKLNLCASR
jgi:hypothetical protein